MLEDFDPINRRDDPFRWIPQGLFYDLMDMRNETGIPIIDQVSGYTNSQMFNAFKSNIVTLQDYRLKLIQQNPGNQSTQITDLFSEYDY